MEMVATGVSVLWSQEKHATESLKYSYIRYDTE